MSGFTTTEIARGFVAQLDSVGVKKATKQLAAFIYENRMHSQLDLLFTSIQAEYQRVYGIVEASVVSAHTLTGSVQKQLESIIAARTGAKKVLLHERIDESVLGGVKVSAPDMELDLTVKTKLARLRS